MTAAAEHSAEEARGSDPIAALYDRFGPALYQYVLLLVGSSADAEDAIQNVFVRLVERARALEDVRHVQAYLYRAARNEAYSVLRRRQRRSEEAMPAAEALLEAPSGTDDALREQVERALLALPPEQREVVVLKVYQRFTLREIASLTACSQNTAASRYRYAAERLRQLLSNWGES